MQIHQPSNNINKRVWNSWQTGIRTTILSLISKAYQLIYPTIRMFLIQYSLMIKADKMWADLSRLPMVDHLRQSKPNKMLISYLEIENRALQYPIHWIMNSSTTLPVKSSNSLQRALKVQCRKMPFCPYKVVRKSFYKMGTSNTVNLQTRLRVISQRQSFD